MTQKTRRTLPSALVGVLLLGITIIGFQNCQPSTGFDTGSASAASTATTNNVSSCSFNGQIVAEGQSITAYATSSVPSGSSCQSQARVCQKGQLSGNYAYASCQPGGAKACLFNGLTVSSGDSVVAYATTSVPSGQSCQSETRRCVDGALSGSFAASSCSVAAATNTNTPNTNTSNTNSSSIPVITGQNTFNFVAGSKADCENSIQSRLGFTGVCAIGAGCGISCGVPGGSCVSANPDAWGACIQVSYGSNTIGGTQQQTYNFVAGTASECQNNLAQKLGLSNSCAVGGGCGVSCGLPGGSCASANPTLPGACVQAYFKLQGLTSAPTGTSTITGNFVCSSADAGYGNSSVDSWTKDQIIARYRSRPNFLGRCPEPSGFYYWTGIALSYQMQGKSQAQAWTDTAAGIDEAAAPVTVDQNRAAADGYCLSRAQAMFGAGNVVSAKYVAGTGNQCTVVRY